MEPAFGWRQWNLHDDFPGPSERDQKFVMEVGNELGYRPPESSGMDEQYSVRTEKEDPDGERIRIVLSVPRADGTVKELQLESVHVSITPQHLDGVISGARLYVQSLDQEAKPPRTPRPWLGSQKDESAQTHPHCVSMVKALKQWHPNSCGYNALYNVLVMLYGEDQEEDTHKRPEAEFWAFVFRCMDRLKARQQECGLWSTSKLENATLDETHLEYLISTDPELCGRCSVINYADVFPVTLQRHIHQNQRHGYILGCGSHWVAGLLAGDRTLYILDSHNKDLTSIVNADESFAISRELMDNYRSVFREKMKEVERYKHYPDNVLESMFDEGITEYWRGQVKDVMWWRHRPAKLRVQILFEEIERAREYIQMARQIFDPQTIESALDGPSKPFQVIPPSRINHEPQADSQGVHTNLTQEDAVLLGFVRRDEEISKEDPAYDPQAPPCLENRKRPPPYERTGDAFDRQRVIPGFDQALIERQACLVLGTGGIGMNVALTLARLGVGRITLVDYDTYDPSNLTRQCLGTREDIGKRKTDVARKNIRAHNLRTEVSTLEADLIKDWSMIVHAARNCTAIFNCCDAGVMIDFAVNSLSKELEIPLVSGQSFGWKYMSEFYTGRPEYNCAFCTEGTKPSFSLHQTSSTWRRFESAWKSHNVASPNEETDGTMTLSFLERFLEEDEAFRLYPGGLGVLHRTFQVPTCEESFAAFLEDYYQASISAMLPGQISKQPSLEFIPRPKTPSTRFVGSWVCPCLACGVTCVSHWTMYLTGPDPERRNPPTCILFNMDEGMTADEQMAYECGLVLDKADRSFARSASDQSCKVCATARKRKLLESLYFGEEKVFLRPVAGGGEERVGSTPAWNYDITEEVLDRKRQAMVGFAEHLRNEMIVPSSASERILIPFVPAVDPVVDQINGQLPYQNPEWPYFELGSSPLVKTTQQDCMDWPGSIEGLASGIRSAVIPVARNGKCYRLKGCGNLHQGFPLQVQGDDGKSVSVRGCSFNHTTARELFMVGYLEVFCGVNCGNRPVGFYRYPDKLPPTTNTEMKWEAAEIDKHCTVFETLGEKRLGDHLLNGLERLMLRGTDWNEQLEQQVIAMVKQAGRWSEEDQSMWDTAMQVECGMEVADFAAILDFPLESMEKLKDTNCAKYADVYNDAIAQIQAACVSHKSLLLCFAKRLGHECGDTLRKMHQGQVSWGTYPDEMGIHCNAHANNFIVQVNSDTNVLAAVDFDMAFTGESFVPGCWVGKDEFFPKDFEGILKFEETMGMKTSLAGSDFTSTGVSNETVSGEDVQHASILRSLLRDTIVSAFEQAYRAEEDIGDDIPSAVVKGLTILCLVAQAESI